METENLKLLGRGDWRDTSAERVAKFAVKKRRGKKTVTGKGNDGNEKGKWNRDGRKGGT